jgi:hypothetical protein
MSYMIGLNQKEDRIPRLPYHIWMHNPRWLHINILPEKLKIRALDKLNSYFEKNEINEHQYQVRKEQIISYLKDLLMNLKTLKD